MIGDQDLARLGGAIANQLEEKGSSYAGIVRQLARRLSELAGGEQCEGNCATPGCRNDVTQPPTGRRRKFCTKCSAPKPSRKTLENSKLAA